MTGPLLTTTTTVPRRDALTTLWYVFTSNRWAALLLVLLALTGLWFQAAANLPALGLPATSAVVKPAGEGTGWESFLAGAGKLDIYSLLWFRLLLALLAFTLLLRLADRLAIVLHLREHLPKAQGLYLGEEVACSSPMQELFAEGELLDRLDGGLGGRLYHVWQSIEEAGPVIYVERLRFVIWGDWLLHLGCLVLIGGICVSAQWGWSEQAVALAAGESYAVSHAPGSTLTLDSTVVDRSPHDAARRYESDLTVTSAGGSRSLFRLSAIRPSLVGGGLALFQVSSGPALRVSVMDRTGQTLLLQAFVQGSKSAPSVVLKFRGAQDEAYLSVPALGVTLRVDRYRSLPEEGYLVPVYLVRAYLGNRATPLFSRTLWKNESYQWQGITYTMTLEDYAVLNVVSDAGWWVAAMGLLLLVVGSILQRWPAPLLARFEAPKVEDEGMTVIEVAVWYRRDREVSGRGAAEAFLKQVGTSEK